MGVGAGLYMYDVVVEKFTFAISSPDEFLLLFSFWAHVNIVHRIVSHRIEIMTVEQQNQSNTTVLEKLYCSDSAVLQSSSCRMHQTFVAAGSLYNVLSPKLSNNSVRELISNSFAMSVDL